jgi:hypothetical protein
MYTEGDAFADAIANSSLLSASAITNTAFLDIAVRKHGISETATSVEDPPAPDIRYQQPCAKNGFENTLQDDPCLCNRSVESSPRPNAAKGKLRPDSLVSPLIIATAIEAAEHADDDQIRPPAAEQTSKASSQSLPYFRNSLPGFGHNKVEFDKIGILYELDDLYYTGVLCTDPNTGERRMCYKWMRESEFTEYLLIECQSCPKVAVGKHGRGVREHTGSWNVHSRKVLNARRACLNEAEDVENKIRHYKMTIGREPEMHELKRVLDIRLA